MRYHLLTRLAYGLVGVVALASPCGAVNPGFIPGDACFHSLLTEDYLQTLRPAGGVIELQYIYPEPMMFCGYGGFDRLTVRNCPPALYDGLRRAYRATRKDHPKLVQVFEDKGGRKQSVEFNGLDLFVCNKNCDWKTQKIGLRYNEHWFDFPINSPRPKSGWLDPRSARMNVPAYRYVSFLSGADADVEDWQNSQRIPGLAVRLPDVKGWEFAGPKIEAPVLANAEDIELVVTCDPLDDYFRQKDGATFYIVRTTGVRQLQWEREKSESGSQTNLADKPVGSE
jgi:hypothetical protein